jgi:hypothetical protein
MLALHQDTAVYFVCTLICLTLGGEAFITYMRLTMQVLQSSPLLTAGPAEDLSKYPGCLIYFLRFRVFTAISIKPSFASLGGK